MSTCLYEKDVVAWAEQQKEYLKSGQYEKLDIEHLLEDLDDVGNSNRNALESYFKVLISHLLKWRHQPSQRSCSWVGSINNSRRSIEKIIKKNPSLKNYLQAAFEEEWDNARKWALDEMGMKSNEISNFCPFNLHYAMNEPISINNK